jgi:hypothetical protein
MILRELLDNGVRLRPNRGDVALRTHYRLFQPPGLEDGIDGRRIADVHGVVSRQEPLEPLELTASV